MIPSIKTHYIDISLDSSTKYYYKIQAIDKRLTESNFSEIAFGTTLFDPLPPEINNSLDDFEIMEDTLDVSWINLYYWFKDINNDLLNFNCTGQKYINVTLNQENGKVILKPEENWNGQETFLMM